MASSTQQVLVQEAYKADASVELPVTASGTAHLVQISIWESVPFLTKALVKDPGKEIVSPVYECRTVICLHSAAQLVTFFLDNSIIYFFTNIKKQFLSHYLSHLRQLFIPAAELSAVSFSQYIFNINFQSNLSRPIKIKCYLIMVSAYYNFSKLFS